MDWTVTPLTPLAARVTGADLSQDLAAADVRRIEALMDRHAVLVFPGQALDQHRQIAFAQRLGPLDLGFRKMRGGPHRFDYAELADISNVKADGSLAGRDDPKIVGNVANQLWHSDSSFQRPRAKYSMLHAVVLPAFGGETEFADLRLAWDALPDWRRRQVEGLSAVHDVLHSRFLLGDTSYDEEKRRALPPVEWPLVQTDRRSGRRILYVGAHACRVTGMSIAEGRMLLSDLLEHATQRAHVYTHRWTVGDLVMWDNTATAHRGRWYDFSERRELRRATTEEVA